MSNPVTNTVSTIKHLHEINGHWAVRMVVPPSLRASVGKRELRKWLGSDRRAAERAAHGVVARFMAIIDEAKLQAAGAAPTLRSAAHHHYTQELLADDRERAQGSQASLALLRRLTSPRRATLLRLLVAYQLSGEEAEALVGYAADEALAAGTADPRLDRRELLRTLAEVQLEAMARFEERDKGQVSAAPTKSQWLEPELAVEAKPAVNQKRAIVGGKTLSELVKDFHKERTAGQGRLAPKTAQEHVVAARMFEEFLGSPTQAAASITADDMLAYKRALMRTPANYRLRFPGLALPDAIEANEKLKTPFKTLEPQTINNKWLGHINNLLKWCRVNRLIDQNPAEGVKIAGGKSKSEPTRVPFNQDDLKRIFGSPLFADPTAYETKQWSLLVSLYTGARSSSEIARIKLADVIEEQGVPVIYLEEASKNAQSKRLVPVHKALIDLGFLAYVERLRKQNKTRLFWDWEPEDKINRWFLRTYKAEVGIIDKRKVFHSFRHTLKTALARYGVNRDVSDLITGHRDQAVSGVYIADASFTMIKSMSEGINRVDFGLPIQNSKNLT